MFDFLLTAETLVAGISLLATFLLGYRTTRLLRAACAGQADIVEIEFAWDFKAFSTMLAPLDDKRIDDFVVGHYWDNAFAIAYSIAFCSLLQLLASHLPPGAGAGLYVISWCGLVAGGFDLLENQCLLRRFATLKRERGKDPVDRPVDVLLRVAAVAAALKFALLGLCVNALAWGLLQGLAHCIMK
jgi:hypothetical protein